MKVIRTFIILFTVLCFSIVGYGQSLSLDDAIQMAIENSFAVKIAKNDLQIANTNNSWGTSGKLPNVSLNLNTQGGYTNIQNPASFLPELSTLSGTLIPGIEASMILYNGNKIKFQKNRLETLELQEQLDLKIAIENLIDDVTKVYYDVLLKKDQLDVAEEILALSRDRIEYLNVKKEFGQAGKFEMLQTMDAYLADSSNYLIQLNNFQNSLNDLHLKMGIENPEIQYVPSDSIRYAPIEIDRESFIEELISNNHSLNALFYARDLTGIQSKIDATAVYPSLNLVSGASYNTGISDGSGTFQSGDELTLDGVKSNTFNYFLGLNASFNIFNGGNLRRNIENNKLRELNAQLNIEDMKKILKSQLEILIQNYSTQISQAKITARQLQNAKENLAISKERFDGGVINSFDYRTIQLNYVNARQSKIIALNNLKLTETQIFLLLGRLVK